MVTMKVSPVRRSANSGRNKASKVPGTSGEMAVLVESEFFHFAAD